MTSHQKGIWDLEIDGHKVRLTIEYIDQKETPPIDIDWKSIQRESGRSEQSAGLLAIIRNKIKEVDERHGAI